MRFSSRFQRNKLIIAVAALISLATPAWFDFQAGLDAKNRGDYETALSEWRPLAEKGVTQAQVQLGWLYFSGHGVSQDYG